MPVYHFNISGNLELIKFIFHSVNINLELRTEKNVPVMQSLNSNIPHEILL